MRRLLVCVLLVSLVLVAAAPAASARARWKKRIDRYARGHSISIAVRDQGRTLYRYDARARRIPASGEKLLMSMALLDELPSGKRLDTIAAAGSLAGGIVPGDLWILGRGDPTITGGGRYGRALPMRATRLGKLARRIADAGVERIGGRVMGATAYFARDWNAPGWRSDFAARYVALPSALTYEGNSHKGRHVRDPERRAAKRLTRLLEKRGVRVEEAPGAAQPPARLLPIARVRSAPLSKLMRFMNRRSSNFFAEVLGKRLAVETGRRPGSIAGGAQAIQAWAARHDVHVDAHDSSGLSYSNRVSPQGMARLLGYAERKRWGPVLRSTLAGGGEGTLEDRLHGVKVRAKTGTLEYVSTLSGWIWLQRTDSWAEFSIMSSGMYKSTAAAIEDKIVRRLTRAAR